MILSLSRHCFPLRAACCYFPRSITFPKNTPNTKYRRTTRAIHASRTWSWKFLSSRVPFLFCVQQSTCIILSVLKVKLKAARLTARETHVAVWGCLKTRVLSNSRPWAIRPYAQATKIYNKIHKDQKSSSWGSDEKSHIHIERVRRLLLLGSGTNTLRSKGKNVECCMSAASVFCVMPCSLLGIAFCVCHVRRRSLSKTCYIRAHSLRHALSYLLLYLCHVRIFYLHAHHFRNFKILVRALSLKWLAFHWCPAFYKKRCEWQPTFVHS